MSENLTWVEIDSQALTFNFNQIRGAIGPQVLFMPVIKSNAYGHGMVEIAKIVSQAGADYLGVVNGDEALFLRSCSITTPILVLSYYAKGQIKDLIQQGVDLVVYNLETAKEISRVASNSNITAKIHVKVDTGTSRLGVAMEDATDFIDLCSGLNMIEVTGVFTHFADSENDDWSFTNEQIEKFRNLLFDLQKKGIKIPIPHAACSSATLAATETHFSMVRIGISLYGLWASEENKAIVQKKYPEFDLKPVLSWSARIIQINSLAKGLSVGYGCSYKAKKDSTIAVLPVGYNEGYSRLLSNKGFVLVKGKKCPVVGRVCMNLCMIDITNIPGVKVDDRVIIIGKQGKNEITADQIATETNTINYEVVTRINSQIPRIIV
ncbi:MAG: alanine racemase [Patescibacteria group bacterium]